MKREFTVRKENNCPYPSCIGLENYFTIYRYVEQTNDKRK